jgi:hypothetical protein
MACATAIVDLQVAAFRPAQFLQRVLKCPNSILCFRVIGGQSHEDPDLPFPLVLLRVRRE